MECIAGVSLLGALGLGLAIGYFLGLPKRRRSAKAPICDCGHTFGSHDPQTGSCQSGRYHYVNNRKKWDDCACMVYTGPEPPAAVWASPAFGLPGTRGVVADADQ